MARRQRIDMVGLRYGRLVGLAYVETGRPHAHWLFRCDCGETTIADGASVRFGKTASCGCLQREVCAARLTRHGHRAARRHDATYRAWQQINTWCTNSNAPRHRDFGAKGIAVDPEWASDYEQFLADMGPRPANTVLRRIDPSRDFCATNCRWAPVRPRKPRAAKAGRVVVRSVRSPEARTGIMV